jgi:chromosome partitioning protein
MSAEIVSVVNQKGGTGKTTTTMNLGCALHHLGKRVLLVDLDPQGNLSYSLGITDAEKTMVDVITGQCKATEALVQREGIDIIPGSPDMADIEVSLAQQEQREKFLKKSLSGLASHYDYILIDSPPSLSLLTINALNAAQSVLVPMQLEVLTLQGLNQILSTVDAVKKTMNTKLKVKGILLVMYDKRRKLSQELQSFLEENVKNRVYDTVIRLNVKLAEAPSFGQSVITYDPSSNGAKDYMAFASEFLSQPA